jgi:hypothetical protein
VEASFNHGNKPSGSIKYWEVAAQLAAFQEGLNCLKNNEIQKVTWDSYATI